MVPFRSTIDHAHRYLHLAKAKRVLLLEALMTLVLVRVCLMLFPFRLIAARLGTAVSPNDALVRTSLEAGRSEHAALASEIGWAVARAACFLPFKASCLPQAIAAKYMLSRRAVVSVLYFGAARSVSTGKPIESHAWLNAANVEVTGYPMARKFSEIACFV